MTYLDRLREIELKMLTHRVGLAECELEYSELIMDIMSKKDEENETRMGDNRQEQSKATV